MEEVAAHLQRVGIGRKENMEMGDWACSDNKQENDFATATGLQLEVW